MAEHSHQMRLLFSLDPQTHLCFSDFTSKWFVSARVEIAEDGMLSGGSEHRDTVQEAINAYLNMLKLVGNTPATKFKQAIKAHPVGESRYYTWNGAAFAECQRPY